MARLRPTHWGICVICHSGAILYEGDVCEHCADLQELQKPLDEARAHVEALIADYHYVGDFGMDTCHYCGRPHYDADRIMHEDDCVYVAALQWLMEAQDDDSD